MNPTALFHSESLCANTPPLLLFGSVAAKSMFHQINLQSNGGIRKH